MVADRTPSAGGLVIQGERLQCGPTLCSTTRARHYLQQGYIGFAAYVMDTQDKGKATVDDVPIVREYLSVFLEGFPGVPLERLVEFRIDLLPCAALIAKQPYQLALP